MHTHTCAHSYTLYSKGSNITLRRVHEQKVLYELVRTHVPMGSHIYFKFNDPNAEHYTCSAVLCVHACAFIYMPMLHHCWLLHSCTSTCVCMCVCMVGLTEQLALFRNVYTHEKRAWTRERMHRKMSVSVCVCSQLSWVERLRACVYMCCCYSFEFLAFFFSVLSPIWSINFVVASFVLFIPTLSQFDSVVIISSNCCLLWGKLYNLSIEKEKKLKLRLLNGCSGSAQRNEFEEQYNLFNFF